MAQASGIDSGHFGDKLSYTNGGVLPHNLSGLMVVGLSGIQRPSKKVCSAEPAWQETLAQPVWKNQSEGTDLLQIARRHCGGKCQPGPHSSDPRFAKATLIQAIPLSTARSG